MKINNIISKLSHVFYVCVHCAHKENLSTAECAHCHKKEGLYFDNSKKYPVVCLHCRDKGMYVTCSKCYEKVYFKAFEHDYKKLIALVLISLAVVITTGFYIKHY